MRANGEALVRYLGKYLSKNWEHRLAEDYVARCVRSFGHWSRMVSVQMERRKGPTNNGRFGWLTLSARTWREMGKQVVIVLKYKAQRITEINIKEIACPK